MILSRRDDIRHFWKTEDNNVSLKLKKCLLNLRRAKQIKYGNQAKKNITTGHHRHTATQSGQQWSVNRQSEGDGKGKKKITPNYPR